MPSFIAAAVNRPRTLTLSLGIAAVLSLEPPAALAADESAGAVTEGGEAPLPAAQGNTDESEEEEHTWLDDAHEGVGRSADRLAQRIDNFYGESVDDFSRAHSRLRLLGGYTYDDVDGSDYRIKIRGKVDLPKINQRLALVFDGEEGNEFGGQSFDDNENRAGFQLNVGKEEDDYHRFDLATNVNSGLDFRIGGRYRYDRELTENFDVRYVQDIAYDTGMKTFARGRPYLNYLTGENSMLRGLGRWTYGEETDGVEWQVGSVWVFKLAEAKAISPFIYAVGDTDPKLTRNYGLGMRYRTAVYKDFLFMDIAPGYMWKKKNKLVDREGTWGINIAFEMHFEADTDAPYGGRIGLLSK